LLTWKSKNAQAGTLVLREMHRVIHQSTIELVQGDITLQEVDAIVNAANSRLAGGGGVDGAIHRRGGPAIMQETSERYPDGCPTGSAVISGAGKLVARHVIHAVGPFWSGGDRGEAELLASAICRSLELAVEHGCKSIALPALSTGAYRYPLEEAAKVAITAAVDVLKERGVPQLVRFVLFDDRALQAFEVALEALIPTSANFD
jgi:O-acetyl-ADP-ribose deacetylase (regulator of RNase III)